MRDTLAVVLGVLLLGCGGDGDANSAPSGDLGAGSDASLDTTVAPDPGPPPAVVLDFVLDTGDDGDACKGTKHCYLQLEPLGSLTLEVRATRDGAAASGIQLKWDITPTSGPLLSIGNVITTTDADGRSSNQVTQTGEEAAEYEIRVWMPDRTFQPIHFHLTSGDGGPPLTVLHQYAGERTFQAVWTTFHKRTVDGEPSCEGIRAAIKAGQSLPMADLSTQPKPASTPIQVVALPGLAADGTQDWAIVGVGKNLDSPPIVLGCTEQTVTHGQSTKAHVVLEDLPLRLAGTWTLGMALSLADGMPPDASAAVGTALDLIQDPTPWLFAKLVELSPSSSKVAGLAGLLTQDPSTACAGASCQTAHG